jgi:hypothetical protein
MKTRITYHSGTSASATGEYATGNCGGYRTIWQMAIKGDRIVSDNLHSANATNDDCEAANTVSMREAIEIARKLGVGI